MQPDFLILGCLLCIVLVLQILALLRRSDHTALDHVLREEHRVGRAELREQLETLERQQEVRLASFARSLTDLVARIDQRLDQLTASLGEDARKGRQEASEGQQRFADALGQRLTELTQRNAQSINEMRTTLEQQLHVLRADNAQQLEQIRTIVDEKLQTTLNTRLDSSFKLVSERLEQVQRGLGEMQQLATGVGDLKRVLTHVKSRGTWGRSNWITFSTKRSLRSSTRVVCVFARMPAKLSILQCACLGVVNTKPLYGCRST